MTLWSLIPVFSKLSALNIDNYQYLMYSNLVSVLSMLVLGFQKKIRLEYIAFFNNKRFMFIHYRVFRLSILYYFILYIFKRKSLYCNHHTIYMADYDFNHIFFLLKEKASYKIIVALIIAFFALIYVATSGKVFSFAVASPEAINLTILAAFVFSILSIISKAFKLPPIALVFYLFLFSFVFSLVANVIFSSIIILHIKSLFIILINGSIINGFSYILWVWALQLGNAVKASVVIMFTPIFSILWVCLLFQDKLYYYHIVSLLLIVAAGILVATRKKQVMKF